MSTSDLPIGVFDSGMGGLTVLRGLQAAFPQESFLYLGDTARLPYGTKGSETVRRYARQASAALVERGVKLLVIACNTAATIALDDLSEHLAPLPVLGVVEPGAMAACEASESGRICVLGTERTVAGGAYEEAIRRIRPEAEVSAFACPMFVALAEAGWFDGAATQAVVRQHLEPCLKQAHRPDCIVLGCTHFPVLTDAIQRVVGDRIRLVDSVTGTVGAVWDTLEVVGESRCSKGSVKFLATDDAQRFVRVGAGFLGRPIRSDELELIDLG